MWRRVYLLLVLVRLYFALSPSYIHPDEHFQGPEVIAGRQHVVHIVELTLRLTFFLRRSIWLSYLQDLGVHIRTSHTKHFPLLARLWLATDCFEMGP